MPLVNLFVQIPAELKTLAGDAAEERNESLAKFVAKVLAVAVGRPEVANLRRNVGRPKKRRTEAS